MLRRFRDQLHLFTTFAGGNVEEYDAGALLAGLALLPVVKTLVDSVEAAALELNDIVSLELADAGIAPGGDHAGGVGVEEVLDIVILLKLVLGDEVVKVPQLSGDKLEAVGSQPCNLLLGGLEVALEVELQLQAGNRVA